MQRGERSAARSIRLAEVVIPSVNRPTQAVIRSVNRLAQVMLRSAETEIRPLERAGPPPG